MVVGKLWSINVLVIDCWRQSAGAKASLVVAVVVVVAVGAASEVPKCGSSVGHDAKICNHLDMFREITVHFAASGVLAGDCNANGDWDYCTMCCCPRGNGAK